MSLQVCASPVKMVVRMRSGLWSKESTGTFFVCVVMDAIRSFLVVWEFFPAFRGRFGWVRRRSFFFLTLLPRSVHVSGCSHILQCPVRADGKPKANVLRIKTPAPSSRNCRSYYLLSLPPLSPPSYCVCAHYCVGFSISRAHIWLMCSAHICP